MSAAGIARAIPARPSAWIATALLVTGSVGAALLVSGVSLAPWHAVVALAIGAIVLAARSARRYGKETLWMAALALSILAGELSAIAFGGQSGRLLWADAVLAIGVAVALIRSDLVLEIPRGSVAGSLLPWIAWCALTLLFARDALTGVAELKEWLAAWAVAVAASRFASDARRARLLLGFLSTTAALVAVLMLLTAVSSPYGWVLAVLMKKVDLPWGRTNYLAGILILAVPPTLGLLVYAASLRSRLMWIVLLLIQFTGLALSASKGAILALVFSLLVAFAWGGRASRLGLALTVALVGAGMASFELGPLQQVLQYRLQASALEYSVGERMNLYRLAWDAFARSPIWGLGLNNFSVAANRLTGVDTVPHNLELGLIAELGLPGIVLAFFWIAAIGRAAWRARAPWRPARDRALGIGVWAAFLGFLAHNQMESTLYGEQYKILLMMFAAAAWRLGEVNVDNPSDTPFVRIARSSL